VVKFLSLFFNPCDEQGGYFIVIGVVIMPSHVTIKRLSAYLALSRRTHLWHGLLAIGFAVVLTLGSLVLRWSGSGEPDPVEPYMTLVNEQLETIFAGTSHVGYDVNPGLYSLSGMNITAGALNYECMEIILEKHLDQAPNLKVLVLEAGIVPLRVDTMSRLDGDYRSLYRIGLDTFDLPLGFYRKSMQWLRESWLLYPVYFMDRWSPSLLVWGTRPLGSEGEGRIDTRGFTPLDRVISSNNNGRVVVEHHRMDHLHVDHSKLNLPALVRIMKMADDRNLPVIFMRMPHHRTYVENRPIEWEAQFQAMLNDVRNVIRPELLHYMDWEQREEFQDDHFADGDHLNVQGVRLLRDILDPVLVELSKKN